MIHDPQKIVPMSLKVPLGLRLKFKTICASRGVDMQDVAKRLITDFIEKENGENCKPENHE